MHSGVIKAFITHQRPPTTNPTHKSSRLSTTDRAVHYHTRQMEYCLRLVCLIGVQNVYETRRPTNEYSPFPSFPMFLPVFPSPSSQLSRSRSRRLLFIMLWTRIIKRLLRSHKQDEWARRKRGTPRSICAHSCRAESMNRTANTANPTLFSFTIGLLRYGSSINFAGNCFFFFFGPCFIWTMDRLDLMPSLQ